MKKLYVLKNGKEKLLNYIKNNINASHTYETQRKNGTSFSVSFSWDIKKEAIILKHYRLRMPKGQ